MDARVVVTGLGAVTPIGIGREKLWEGLMVGRSGFSPVESFDTSGYHVHLGAEVRDFDPVRYVRRCDANVIGRASQFAIAASRLALDDAGLSTTDLNRDRTGVAVGTTSGEPKEVELFNDAYLADAVEDVGPEFIRRYPCHMISTYVARELELEGVNVMIPTACAAGNYAVAYGVDALRLDQADVMLAGGADCFSRITYTGFARLGAIAPELCQPFDRKRRGMIPGEGAGVLVLESRDKAIARGARIYAEVAGYGLSCDAHHMTGAHPEGFGAARAMRLALADSGLNTASVSYISAHGTGTATNDRIETAAVKRVFGEQAYKVPISSVKSMLGHTMGAASAIEACVCALAVHTDVVPPTVNYEEPDPDCDLDYVMEGARALEVNVAMNNAYAFGGNNASVVFRKPRMVTA